VVSNKKYRGKEKRTTAIEFLILSLVEWAKRMNVEWVYTHIKSNKLEDHFVNVGFNKSCNYSSELIKKL